MILRKGDPCDPHSRSPAPGISARTGAGTGRAHALAAYIRSANAPFPEDFPRADILAVTEEMAELPDETAQGSLPHLEYADMRLADIQNYHFTTIDPAQTMKGDPHPVLARDEGIDRDLSGLIVAIATARRVANHIAAAEPERKDCTRPVCHDLMRSRVSPTPNRKACASPMNCSKPVATSTKLLCHLRSQRITSTTR